MPRKTKADEKVLERARKRVDAWYGYYSTNNKLFREDIKFCYGNDGAQWDDDQKKEYSDLGKPVFSFNMLPKYVNNIIGEYELNTPDFKVSPTLDTPNEPDKIKLVTGMLRHISLKSRNDIVYQTALSNALVGGYGSFRIVVAPESTYSFNMQILYKAIQDPTQCGWDTAARELDKNDGSVCFIITKLTHDEYKVKYPGTPIPEDFSDYNSSNVSWGDEKMITVCDYYEKKYFDVKIYQLSDGQSEGRVVQESDLEEVLALNPQLKVIDETKRQDYVIKYYRLSADRVLEKSKWDGKKLPIIFQPGILKYIDGKESTISFIRYVKDAQRSYNWARSQNLFQLGTATYAPWIASETNVEGHEEQWNQAYKQKSVLVFKESPSGKEPRRTSPIPADPGLMAEMERSFFDIQNVQGRYEASAGAQGNELSGRAIESRQRPSNMSVMPFFNNATKAIGSGAIAVLDLIPHVYDTERRMVLTNPDGSPKDVTINAEGGSKNSIDGTYDAEVSVGASFEMQQRESVETLLKLGQAEPQLLSLGLDILVENLDIKGQARLLERVKEGPMKNVISQEKGEKPQMSPQQQQMMQQQQLMMQRMTAEIKETLASAQQKQSDSQATLMDAETDRFKVMHNAGVETKKIQAEEQRTQVEAGKVSLALQKELLDELTPKEGKS